jgi:hypothetical protein
MAKQDEGKDKMRKARATALGNGAKAEWVALMCAIAKRNRDLYRELRAEAWDSVVRSGIRSTTSN